LKSTVSILLAISLLLPTLSKVWILVDFKINQKEISELLCINREQQIPICKGKCFLEKQLNKTEEQDKKPSTSQKKDRIELTYQLFRYTNYIHKDQTAELNKLLGCMEVTLNLFHFISDIFHPPQE
jgi:hypothetical protein